MFTDRYQTLWDEYLNAILFGIRTTISKGTNETPFSMLFGFEARAPIDTNLLPPSKLSISDSEYRAFICKNIAVANEQGRVETLKQQDISKRNYDKKAGPTKIKINDMVYLHDPVKKKGLSRKLHDHYLGPYKVIDKTGERNFRLDGLKGKTHDNIHVDRLKKVKPLHPKSLRTENEELEEDIDNNNETEESISEVEITEPKGKDIGPTQQNQSDHEINKSEAQDELAIIENILSTIQEEHPEIEVQEKIDLKEATAQEEILDHRRRRQRIEFLTKHKEEPLATAQWKRREQLSEKMVANYLNSRPSSYNTRTKRTVGNVLLSVQYIVSVIFSFWIKFGLADNVTNISLGPLYSCDESTLDGAYSLPPDINCAKPTDPPLVRIYKAKVSLYNPGSTEVRMFLCRTKVYTLTCEENFFGGTTKHNHHKDEITTYETCAHAMKTHNTKFGRLYKHSGFVWSTSPKPTFVCSWMKTRTATYKAFEILELKGKLYGKSDVILQTITQTICHYKNKYCVPKEKPKAVIVFSTAKHIFQNYKYLGIYKIRQVNQYILIPDLSIAGAIVFHTKDHFLLDVGVKIIKPNAKEDIKFSNFSEEFTKEETFNRGQEMTEAKFIKDAIKNSENVFQLTDSICNINKKINKLHHWIFTHFPETADSLVTAELGKWTEISGDALIIHSCKKILTYEVLWNQKVNNTCFVLYPVYLGKTLLFLDIQKRRLHRRSPKTPCPSRQKATFLTDENKTLWRLDTDNWFKKVPDLREHVKVPHTILSKISDFNSNLIRFSEKPPPQNFLLNMVASNSEVIEEIGNIQSEGGGSFVAGVAEGLGKLIDSTASGGSKLINAVGKTIKSSLEGGAIAGDSVFNGLTKTTTGIIRSSGQAFSDVIKSFGANLAVWILLLLILCFLGSQFWPNSPFKLNDLHQTNKNQEELKMETFSFPVGNFETPEKENVRKRANSLKKFKQKNTQTKEQNNRIRKVRNSTT